MYKKTLVVSLVSLIACLSGQAALSMGVKHAAPAQFQEFKLIPRVNLWGFAGDYTRGEGQALLPIWGDAGRALYFLAEGNKVVNTSEWMGGAGFGYRQVYNDDIFGGYLIGNYHNSEENNGFYIGNLGLEMLGQAWDINVNGYLPFMQKKSIEASDVIASEDLGITNFIRFSGHNEFDHKIRVFTDGHGHRFGEEAGRGFDAEVGRIIPKIENLRMYLGGYHFDNDDADAVNGVEARAVLEFNRYLALEGEYNYDNVSHSKAVLGLRFTLGGYSAAEKKHYGISTRLLDPIEHDLIIGSSGVTSLETVGRTIDLEEVPIHDNLQFFKPLALGSHNATNAQQGSGTYEDPFIGLTLANFNAINPHLGTHDTYPLMYFAPGNYNFAGFTVTHPILGDSGTVDVPNRFLLPNGWGMYGRTADYKAPAMGDERAHFDGGIDMTYNLGAGDAQTTLNSIRLLNTVSEVGIASAIDNAALYLINATNIVLQNSDIEKNLVDTETLVGIFANRATINFKKLSDTVDGANTIGFNLESNVGTSAIYGFNPYPGGPFIINFESGNNTIASESKSTVEDAYLYNVYFTTTSEMNFKGGVNTINTTTAAIGSSYSIGVYLTNSTITFSGGNNTFNSTANGIHTVTAVLYGGANSIIDFRGGTAAFNCNNTVSISGDNFAINLDGGDIQVNEASIDSGSGADYSLLTPFASFSRVTGGAGTLTGDAIIWPGHGNLSW